MDDAIRLARRGLEGVSPNPLVGAIVVRGGAVVGKGWHRRFGGPHAEVEALRASGSGARGADLYVSLEPCGHQGKTPPCSRAIVEAGVARVFYAASDPNPDTRGRGPRLLRRAGVEVHRGLCEEAAVDLNAPYFHWRRTGRPWVILKWAMTADGKIATHTGDSRWISGERSRRHAHGLRRRVDAVLVGTGTLLSDDPNLLPRPARGRRPLRVILDRRGRLPLDLQILGSSATGPRLYITSSSVRQARLRTVEAAGVETLRVATRRGRFDLQALLAALGDRGVSQILVEGGEALHGDFWERGLVDEVVVFVAAKVLGGRGSIGAIGGSGPARIADACELLAPQIRRLGDDVLIQGRVRCR